MTLLLDAQRKDPELNKFAVALAVFQLAVLRTPRDHRCLLNLGLVQCLLYGQNYVAEKLFRRALAYAPLDERTAELWKFVKDRFPERTIAYNPLSRLRNKANGGTGAGSGGLRSVTVHGRAAQAHSQWAGWVYVANDPLRLAKTVPRGSPYWYNPADGRESLDEPRWEEQWRERRARSVVQEEDAHAYGQSQGLQQYFDPLTAEYFAYHPLSDTYA